MSFKANKQIKIVTTSAELDTLFERLASAEYLAVDTETTGLTRFAKAIGISFSPSATEGYYIPLLILRNGELYDPRQPDTTAWLKERLIEALTQSKRLVLHNAPFDAKILNTYLGINIMPYVFCDTAALAHLVYNEEGPLGLKPLATELLDPEASNPQDEVKASVLANGGTVTKTNFEMWKCDYKILGNYAAWDTIYTYNLFEKLYPEIQKQGLTTIWEEEVLPLCSVTYELNTTGIRVNIPYFEQLKKDIEAKIVNIEDEIYALIADDIKEFELAFARSKIKITKQSTLGKRLVEKGIATLERIHGSTAKTLVMVKPELVDDELIAFYKEQAQVSRIFNLDSGDHKAYLMYDILKLPCNKQTASGKRAVDAATMKELCEQYEDQAPVLKKIMERAKEQKLLSTYVEAILTHHENGRMYSSFNQTATLSGRYSCSFPLNLQTLPREDVRIKAGFIPDEGNVLVAMDYESAEPKIFAHVSGDAKLKDIFRTGLDFYSKIAIDTEKLTDYSADKEAVNYLGAQNKKLRQAAKAYSLGIAYGMKAGKLAIQLKIDIEDAKKLVNAYLEAYPALNTWMQDSEEQAKELGYVVSLAGRKRRLPNVHYLHTKLGVKKFYKKALDDIYNKYKGKLPFFDKFEDGLSLYLTCNNELNNAKNFQIQSLAASVTNAAMIKFQTHAHELQAKIALQVHDEVIVTCPAEFADKTARLLEDCMLNNRVTKTLDVPMVGNAIITDKSLVEAK